MPSLKDFFLILIFQDEVGRVTLAVCNTIAHGVLLFLPSYSLLNKLCERWQNTGLWNELCNKKVVISEPRFADEFESSMRHFYEVIESTTNYTKEGVNGALFIAVCRGKVSEGLIFFVLFFNKFMTSSNKES